MILDDFYTLNTIQQEQDDKFVASIFIHKEHPIFKGHFPNNPVMPGVCMIQIVKEITAKILARDLTMRTAKNIKFMELINPEKNSDLQLHLEIKTLSEDEIQVKNTTFLGEKVGLKMNINYSLK